MANQWNNTAAHIRRMIWALGGRGTIPFANPSDELMLNVAKNFHNEVRFQISAHNQHFAQNLLPRRFKMMYAMKILRVAVTEVELFCALPTTTPEQLHAFGNFLRHFGQQLHDDHTVSLTSANDCSALTKHTECESMELYSSLSTFDGCRLFFARSIALLTKNAITELPCLSSPTKCFLPIV
ncbi:hypothetical protein niasHT_019854 [Heterodera trifolii]|uniref:Uncharacterized protein n=1 Tax=Heterodera trifolii TaxID=157864 RepID=A0ABD2KUU9_9BILA